MMRIQLRTHKPESKNLKLNNSSSLNKGNHLILSTIDFYYFISPFFNLVLVSMEKVYYTLKAVFDHVFQQFKVCQKYSATRRILFGNVVFNLCLI